MSEADLRARILGYDDYTMTGGQVPAAIDHDGLAALLDTLAAMLTDADAASAVPAMLFVRDAWFTDRRFRDAYSRSAVLDAVRGLRFHPSFLVRSDALYTMGKIGPVANADVLAAALPWYIDHDPLNLDRLLFELHWLRRRSSWRGELEQVVASRHHLARLAATGILAERIHSRGARLPGWAVQMLRRLTRDPHEWVRTEARWRLYAHRHRRPRRIAGRPVRRGDRVALKRRIDAVEPVPTFEKVCLVVGNELHRLGRADYDAGFVDAVRRRLTDVTPRDSRPPGFVLPH